MVRSRRAISWNTTKDSHIALRAFQDLPHRKAAEMHPPTLDYLLCTPVGVSTRGLNTRT